MADGEAPQSSPTSAHLTSGVKQITLVTKQLFSDVVKANNLQISGHPQGLPASTSTMTQRIESDSFSLKPISIHQGKPAVVFKTSDKQLLMDKLKYVLVGKFSHGRPPMSTIQGFFTGLKLQGQYNISLFDQKHVFIELVLKIDYVRLWMELVFFINSLPMRLFRWDETFSPSKESVMAPVWIRIEGLPLYLFDAPSLWSIANAVGKPLRIDPLNLNRRNLHSAYICVELNVTAPLIDSIWIAFEEDNSKNSLNGFWVQVFYNVVPPYCTACYHLGHDIKMCKRLKDEAGFDQNDGNREVSHVADQVLDKMPQPAPKYQRGVQTAREHDNRFRSQRMENKGWKDTRIGSELGLQVHGIFSPQVTTAEIGGAEEESLAATAGEADAASTVDSGAVPQVVAQQDRGYRVVPEATDGGIAGANLVVNDSDGAVNDSADRRNDGDFQCDMALRCQEVQVAEVSAVCEDPQQQGNSVLQQTIPKEQVTLDIIVADAEIAPIAVSGGRKLVSTAATVQLSSAADQISSFETVQATPKSGADKQHVNSPDAYTATDVQQGEDLSQIVLHQHDQGAEGTGTDGVGAKIKLCELQGSQIQAQQQKEEVRKLQHSVINCIELEAAGTVEEISTTTVVAECEAEKMVSEDFQGREKQTATDQPQNVTTRVKDLKLQVAAPSPITTDAPERKAKNSLIADMAAAFRRFEQLQQSRTPQKGPHASKDSLAGSENTLQQVQHTTHTASTQKQKQHKTPSNPDGSPAAEVTKCRTTSQVVTTRQNSVTTRAQAKKLASEQAEPFTPPKRQQVDKEVEDINGRRRSSVGFLTPDKGCQLAEVSSPGSWADKVAEEERQESQAAANQHKGVTNKVPSKKFHIDLPIDFDPMMSNEDDTERMSWSQLISGSIKLLARRSVSPVGRSSEKLIKLRNRVDFLDHDAGKTKSRDK